MTKLSERELGRKLGDRLVMAFRLLTLRCVACGDWANCVRCGDRRPRLYCMCCREVIASRGAFLPENFIEVDGPSPDAARWRP